MVDLLLRVEGMRCDGCEDRVERVLSGKRAVRSVEADHRAGTVGLSLVAGRADRSDLREAVEDLGYNVVDEAGD